MNPNDNFNLNDDNFWTNAFRECEGLLNDAEDEDLPREFCSAVSGTMEELRLSLGMKNSQSTQQLCFNDIEWDLLPEEWDAVKTCANMAAGDNMKSFTELVDLEDDERTASTPSGDIGTDDTDYDGCSDSWSAFSVSDEVLPCEHTPPLLQAPVVDEKYMEYYEFLSNGFDDLFKELHSSDCPPSCPCNEQDIPRSMANDETVSSSTQSHLSLGDASSVLFNSLPSNLDCGEKSGLSCKGLKPNLYYQYNPGTEIYSRKVFVGGLPLDVDEDELMSTFSSFGNLTVDWPNKSRAMPEDGLNSSVPKGYVFLIFKNEFSVRKLVDACFCEDEKFFFFISSLTIPQKLVQIRPWKLADADYIVDVNMPVDLRRVVFVGGVPRPIRAVELAHIMDKMYGSVVCAGIDTDLEHKYPKGAGRVAFSNDNSFLRAITDRFAQLSHGERLRVEMKPYVLDDQGCDECDGMRYAPFFCPHLDCLQYYCESCWTDMHSCPSMQHHKPLVKEV